MRLEVYPRFPESNDARTVFAVRPAVVSVTSTPTNPLCYDVFHWASTRLPPCGLLGLCAGKSGWSIQMHADIDPRILDWWSLDDDPRVRCRQGIVTIPCATVSDPTAGRRWVAVTHRGVIVCDDGHRERQSQRQFLEHILRYGVEGRTGAVLASAVGISEPEFEAILNGVVPPPESRCEWERWRTGLGPMSIDSYKSLIATWCEWYIPGLLRDPDRSVQAYEDLLHPWQEQTRG